MFTSPPFLLPPLQSFLIPPQKKVVELELHQSGHGLVLPIHATSWEVTSGPNDARLADQVQSPEPPPPPRPLPEVDAVRHPPPSWTSREGAPRKNARVTFLPAQVARWTRSKPAGEVLIASAGTQQLAEVKKPSLHDRMRKSAQELRMSNFLSGVDAETTETQVAAPPCLVGGGTLRLPSFGRRL